MPCVREQRTVYKDGCRRPETLGRTHAAHRTRSTFPVVILPELVHLWRGTEWLRCFGISPITAAAAGDVFGFSDDCRVPRPPPMVNQLCGHVPARRNEFHVRRDPTRRPPPTTLQLVPLRYAPRANSFIWSRCTRRNHRSLTSYHVVLADGVRHRCLINAQLWCLQIFQLHIVVSSRRCCRRITS